MGIVYGSRLFKLGYLFCVKPWIKLATLTGDKQSNLLKI